MPAAPLHDVVTRLDAALAAPRGQPVRVAGLRGSAPALCLARLVSAQPRPVVALLATTEAAESFTADLRYFLGERETRRPLERRVHHLPGWEIPPFESLSPTRETLAARAEGLYHLLQTRDPVIVTTVEAWMLRCVPRPIFSTAVGYVVAGEEQDLGSLAAHLVAWGYHRVPQVEDPGELAVRGGLLDVFPPGYVHPVRLEFLGDTVESVRTFDPSSQRSLEPQEDVLLLPMQEFSTAHLGPDAGRRVDERAAEIGLARGVRRELVEAVRRGLVLPGTEQLLPYLHDTLATLADYLPEACAFWIQESAAIETGLAQGWADVQAHAEAALDAGRFHPPPEQLYLPPVAAAEALQRHARVEVEEMELVGDRVLHAGTHATESLAIRIAPGAESPLAAVAGRLRAWESEGSRIVLVAPSVPRRDRMQALLGGHGIRTAAGGGCFLDEVAAAGSGALALVGGLSRGTWLRDDRLVVLTEAELFGDRHQIRRARRARAAAFSALAELRPDDYVVHVDHGIGMYRGLRHMAVAGTAGDYLHLEYLGGDRLYLPVDRINLVQRYVSGDAGAPALDKLGGASWERVKERARESVLAMAHELLEVYAAREVHARRPCDDGDGLYREFAARFPFEETPDQLRAIDDVLADLGGTKPMDRLVCGDVGFGKTEVALRAAFLAVLAGRQVAVLVPTTVLAQQHLQTFRTRFEGCPITVGVVSRFRTAAENRETLGRVAAGRLDVVIGTHRLLQPDVTFRQLGLLVVDEEHRFGVRAKERIRQLRPTVDVLTLTATPIPRTLNMSLSGIRDLSVIETPPVDRLAIRTYVTRYEDAVVRDAVLRELARGGQVFYVHNRVADIDGVAARLDRLVPEARIAVGHGQMPERALESTMLRFMRGEVNLLVTSSIIESGLDIPTANTLIVDRADHFGLAQLYQMRGRIGRSHLRAYAYLLIPGEHLITPDAQKRLRALQELDDLGGGFRLAARDLEIRGAGNLLGKQQSGNIAAVGLELYTNMLERAVSELRGETRVDDLEPEIQLGIPAFIPETYVADVSQRLVAYKRLAGIRGADDLEAITEELADRYGPLPPEVDTLVRIMDLRRRLKDARVRRARRKGDAVLFEFDANTSVVPDRLLAEVERRRGRLRLLPDSTLEVRPAAEDHDGLLSELGTLLQSLMAT